MVGPPTLSLLFPPIRVRARHDTGMPAKMDMDGLGTEIGRGLEMMAPSLGAELGKGLEKLGPLLSSAVEAAVGKNKERDLEKVSSFFRSPCALF